MNLHNSPNANYAICLDLLEEWDDLVGKHFCCPESLGVQHDLSNQLTVGLGHGQATEQFLQVVWEVWSSGIARVHCDEDGHVWTHFYLFVQQFTGNGGSSWKESIGPICMLFLAKSAQKKLHYCVILKSIANYSSLLPFLSKHPSSMIFICCIYLKKPPKRLLPQNRKASKETNWKG